MFKVILLAVTLVFLVTTFKFAYLASTSVRDPGTLAAAGHYPLASEPQQTHTAQSTTSTTTTQEPGIGPKNRTMATPLTTPSATARPPPSESTQPAPPITTTPFDPDTDPDDVPFDVPAVATPNTTLTNNPITMPPSLEPPDKTVPTNPNKPQLTKIGAGGGAFSSAAELSVLFYSIFIVYVSFVKLAYHNIHFIKHNLTEQGILMIFGIIWQLVARQISSDYGSFPRFNSRIFFYLFLPSTVLESASMLSNKWLFFNLLPILTHSIVGTVLYASSMGFTIFALSRSEIFTSNWMGQLTRTSGGLEPASAASRSSLIIAQPDEFGVSSARQLQQLQAQAVASTTSIASGNTGPDLDVFQNDFSNLTLADCLVVGTILSSIDSAPMLNVFKQYQVNEKLYYLVLGENLLNQAVVITLFNLLIEFFETTRLTVVKCYIAILQFFANLIGAVLIGVVLALFALISVRLIKRFQVPHALSSYHNQCQAMVETLLILKLAYLTYTLSNLAGTSSILGLATFGILNDQYIKHNLNLRSQLAFKQVILGMRTLGFSLVYPLLGMLLVDTAMSSSAHSSAGPMGTLLLQATGTQRGSLLERLASSSSLAMAVTATGAHRPPPSQTSANLSWNFKFLSIVILLTIVYRFLIVISLGIMGNVLTCGQLKIKFKEQVLMAYGGFKGPLSIALVHSLIEHEDHKERIARNKHLFKYTILINIFISAVLAGTFIRPLVARIQSTLIGRTSTSLGDSTSSTIVFEHINYKLTEYASHGLNSILGHTRSPYDKFIEFNETHIKPWLVRADCNTNWLSVFYDNLILDETLNANCFYIVTEDPTTMRVLKLKLEDDKSRMTGWLRRRTSSVSFLDTISESGGGAQSAVQSSSVRDGGYGVARSKHVSLLPPNPGRSLAGQRELSMPREFTLPNDREVLKEFVMLNLRLENARRRRVKRGASSIINNKQHERRQQQPGQRTTPATGHPADDDSSVANSDPPGESSLDRASRQVHLRTMEANLGSVDNYKALSASTSAVGHENPLRSHDIEEPARVEKATVHRAGLDNAVRAAAEMSDIETMPTRGKHRQGTEMRPFVHNKPNVHRNQRC